MPLAYIALCAYNKLQYKVFENYTLCTLAYIALCAFNKLQYKVFANDMLWMHILTLVKVGKKESGWPKGVSKGY